MLAAQAAARTLVRGHCVRALSTRPGQPLDLNRYDKGPEAIPIPGSVYAKEAEAMGVLKPLAEPLNRRPVPKGHGDFEVARGQFNRGVSTLRKQYASEWAARRQREAAVESSIRAAVQKKREAAAAVRVAKRAAALQATEAAGEAATKARAAKLEQSLRTELRRAERVSSMRGRWLAALERDASRWIPEDRIDAMITPDLFSLKYAWQFERWFEVKERKRQLREEARRNKRPGQPLREVVLGDADAEFASDWESDEESSTSASRAADADAAGDVKVQQALALARRADRERGFKFPEPAYDAQGRLLPPSSSSAGAAAAASRDARTLSLAELYHGKRIEDILRDYEQWMTSYLESSKPAPAPAAAATGDAAAAAAPVATASTTASVLDDDGERETENAYIDVCIGMGHVEGLYYALVRKCRRLERGGHTAALQRLEGRWGKWMSQLERNAGGVFTASGGEKAAAAAAATAGGKGGLSAAIQDTAAAASGAGGGAGGGEVVLGNVLASEAIAASAPPIPAEEVARVAAATSSGSSSSDSSSKAQ